MDAERVPYHFETAWLDGPKYDGLFIIGVLFLATFSGAIVFWRPDLFQTVLFLDLWFLGYHHVISTFTKLAGTRSDRRKNWFLLYPLPFLVLTGVIGLCLTVGVWSVVTVYFFWQWYHYVRQSYGISVFYRRKAEKPVTESDKLAYATLWCVPLWGILTRCGEGWKHFLGQEFYTPQVPAFLVDIVAFISIGLVATWFIRRILNWFRGDGLPLGHTLFMSSHFLVFYLGYIWMDHIDHGWLIANIWHNAQYVLFVWLYQKNRFSKETTEAQGGTAWLQWFSQKTPLHIAAYFLTSLALTTIVYRSVQWGFDWIAQDLTTNITLHVIFFQAVNFHHYIVDSQIWKARKKVHQKVMGISSGQT